MPTTYPLLPVLSLQVCPHATKVFLYSTFDGAYVRKNTRLSPPAQLQCSRSRAEEPGNEAIHTEEWTDRYTDKLTGMEWDQQCTQRPP